jgi:hypothetical protein
MRKQEDAYSIPKDYIPDYIDDTAVDKYSSRRYRMVDWMFQINETFSFDEETIEITLSILDRYVALNPGLMLDSDAYQLAALTSIYIAAKIHEDCCLTPDHMKRLSGNEYSTDILEKQERLILDTIQWRVNPPTSSAFARELLNVIPSEVIQRDQILTAFKDQIHSMLYEEFFVPEKASKVAIAALYNVLASVPRAKKLPKYVELRLLGAAGLSKHNTNEITKLQELLIEISTDTEAEPTEEQTEVVQPTKQVVFCPSTPIESTSPRTVTAAAG